MEIFDELISKNNKKMNLHWLDPLQNKYIKHDYYQKIESHSNMSDTDKIKKNIYNEIKSKKIVIKLEQFGEVIRRCWLERAIFQLSLIK